MSKSRFDLLVPAQGFLVQFFAHLPDLLVGVCIRTLFRRFGRILDVLRNLLQSTATFMVLSCEKIRSILLLGSPSWSSGDSSRKRSRLRSRSSSVMRLLRPRSRSRSQSRSRSRSRPGSKLSGMSNNYAAARYPSGLLKVDGCRNSFGMK